MASEDNRFLGARLSDRMPLVKVSHERSVSLFQKHVSDTVLPVYRWVTKRMSTNPKSKGDDGLMIKKSPSKMELSMEWAPWGGRLGKQELKLVPGFRRMEAAKHRTHSIEFKR